MATWLRAEDLGPSIQMLSRLQSFQDSSLGLGLVELNVSRKLRGKRLADTSLHPPGFVSYMNLIQHAEAVRRTRSYSYLPSVHKVVPFGKESLEDSRQHRGL